MPPENQPKINKKTAIIILVIILALLGIGWYVYKKQKAPAGLSQEEILKRQLAELERLRQSADYKPLTEEQIKKQSLELKKLNQQAGYKPLTQEQINKQLEEFNKLKGQ